MLPAWRQRVPHHHRLLYLIGSSDHVFTYLRGSPSLHASSLTFPRPFLTSPHLQSRNRTTPSPSPSSPPRSPSRPHHSSHASLTSTRLSLDTKLPRARARASTSPQLSKLFLLLAADRAEAFLLSLISCRQCPSKDVLARHRFWEQHEKRATPFLRSARGDHLLRFAEEALGVTEGNLGRLCARHAASEVRQAERGTLVGLHSVASFGFLYKALTSVLRMLCNTRVGVVSTVFWVTRFVDAVCRWLIGGERSSGLVSMRGLVLVLATCF